MTTNQPTNLLTLEKDVFSCDDAAKAKGIPLKNELKSLVIVTSKGEYLLHLRGDRLANWRTLKKLLQCDQVFLAPPEVLAKYDCCHGTVNPFNEKLAKLPQIVSRELLELEFVSTNAGTHRTYVKFDPKLLSEMGEVIFID